MDRESVADGTAEARPKRRAGGLCGFAFRGTFAKRPARMASKSKKKVSLTDGPVKLMAANRSEIAIRIFRAATEMNMRTVAIYAQEDRLAVHRFKADEAYMVGMGKGPVGAYLDIDGIVEMAKERGVNFIHPGYGFLAENADFAEACAKAGLTFVGPRPELLRKMGDKTEARALAKAAGVPILPGTDDPITTRAKAVKVAKEIGFPLIIKAAFGGGGRGMRVVHKAKDLERLLDEARGEADRAFGNPAVFLEKYVPRAKHIEVQILGDQHGNVLHLYERDCSVQRRHQKVVEIAPSVALDESVRSELCSAAVELAKHIRYDNAGTMEFLYDMDSKKWYFIEMNPRIQVEHTVTEVVTGIDLVRAQIQVAQGGKLHGDVMQLPKQKNVPCVGHAVQARVTTEDPANNFTPDYGRIIAYRSAAGFGVRLDGGQGDAGSVITPFYDSLLVKITASGMSFPIALDRMDRALKEFRIRGVQTNIPFIENVIKDETFRTGQASTTLIDTTPELFTFRPRRDRANRLLSYIGDVVVNGNPQAKGFEVKEPFAPIAEPAYNGDQEPPAGTRQILLEKGPKKFAEWARKEKRLLITDTTLRDAHQSLFATRMRTEDMLNAADAIARRTPNLFSLEMWGGATFDTAMRFLREDPWQRLRQLREAVPNICFQMLFRGSNAVGYSDYPDNVVKAFVKHSAENGMDIFRIFDSLNYLPNLKAAMEAVQDTHAICEGTICYTGNFLDEKRDKYPLEYYVKLAKELEKMGAHTLCIKDMAGLCRPYAANKLVKTLRQEVGVPIHFHTHDTSGVNAASVLKAAEAGVDIADLAIASMSGSTSQPNLNSVVAALDNTPRETGLDLGTLNEFSDYWEAVRRVYAPFDTGPRSGIGDIYEHEMPGGQYTNLREQAESMGLGARWNEVARTYAEVNDLFGDIVKVTPSSKVVGDMTMFLVTRGIKPADVVNLEPGATPFPQSVIDMMKGRLGKPVGGWPRKVQQVVLGKQKPLKGRPGADLKPLNLERTRKKLEDDINRKASDDDLLSHLMYPEVFKDYNKFRRQYGDVSVLPSSTYFYGLQPGEEIAVDIEVGKTLYIKLINISEADEEGVRTLTFELNGYPREVEIADASLNVQEKAIAKADPGNDLHVGAPIPGIITELAVGVGAKVAKGDKLITMEAMKMQTTVYAAAAGVVDQINVAIGDSVESKDLIMELREA